MVTVILLSRTRTLEEYGTYSQLLLVGNLTASIFMLGLPNSVNYFLGKARDIQERKDFLSVYYLLSTCLGIVTGLILVLSVPLIEKYFGNSLITSFAYVLATYPWFQIILSGIDNVFIVYKKMNFLVIFKVSNAILLLAAVIFVDIFQLGFSFYMLIFVGIEVTYCIAVYLIVPKVAGMLSFPRSWKLVRDILVFSIPLGLASSTGIITAQFDKLLIGWKFDTAALAIYTNASRELPVTLLAGSLTAVVMPVIVRLLSRNRISESIFLWGRSTLIGFAFLSFFALGVFTFPGDTLTFLYSEKYSSGAAVMQIYALVLLFRPTYFGMFLSSTGRSKSVLWTSLCTLLLSVVFGLAGYHLFGFIGPALGSLIAIAATQFAQLILTSRYLNVSFARIFPWRGLLYILLLNILLACLAVLAKWMIPIDESVGSVIETLIIGCLWATIYFGLMFRYLRHWWFDLRDPGEAPVLTGY
ncbi:oligosaccharide flippase family protein [Glutamicibacter bergerei]